MNNVTNFGIVGTGLIAKVIATAITKAKDTRLKAVSSRSLTKAEEFCKEFETTIPYDNWREMLKDIDAVYIATPTACMEEIGIEAAKKGVHILIDKPMMSKESHKKVLDIAASNSTLVMDATHFPHHPRTKRVQEEIEKSGKLQSLHTSFFAPIHDKSNIRYNTKLEPAGALGDLGWYCMRAIVEYLQPKGLPTNISASAIRDSETNAIVRVSGLLEFEDEKTATFQSGFNSNLSLMDLQIIAEQQSLFLEDYVLDFCNSFAFNVEGHIAGFTVKHGQALPGENVYIETPSTTPQEVKMIERFSKLVNDELVEEYSFWGEQTQRTQELVDLVFNHIS